MRRRAAALADAPAARLVAIGLMLTLAVVAAIAVVTVHRHASPPRSLAGPIEVEPALSTTTALFGDPVEAEVDVYTSERRVPLGSVRLATDFRPYRVVATRVGRAHQGSVSLLLTRFTLQCLARACLPPHGGARVVRFPAIAVTYVKDGRATRALIPWSPLKLSSRIPSDVSPAAAIVDTAPPLEPRFARSPTLAVALLLAAVAILGIVGAVLVVTALWPRSLLSRRRWQQLAPLERSLARVEAAAGSVDEHERRRTLDQLAMRLSEVPAPTLEADARELAWGPGPPGSEALLDLAAQVRTTLNGKVRA